MNASNRQTSERTLTQKQQSGRITLPMKPFLVFIPILTIVCTVGSTILGGPLIYLYFYPETQTAYTEFLNRYVIQGLTLLLPNVSPQFTVSETYNISIAACVISIIVSLLSVRLLRSVYYSIQLNMPHVPERLPYLGNVQDFLTTSPWDLMTQWHSLYGPIYSFTLLGRNCVSIAHPGYLRTMLQGKVRSSMKDVKFAYQPFLSILGTGIVTSEGESWKSQRLSVSSVLRHDVLEVIPGITLRAVQRLCQLLDNAEKEHKVVDLSEELRHLTLQVISELFFSLSAKESDETFAKMYLPIMEESHKRVWHPERKYAIFLPAFWKNIRNVNCLNNYVSTLILKRWAQRRQQDYKPSHDDLLERVLTFYERKYGLVPLSRRDVCQLRDEMKTFVLAGHETSAAMMTWAFYEILNKTTEAERLLSKVKEEAASVFGKHSDWCSSNITENDLPTAEELSKLVISEAVLKESLRKYSVVPVVSRIVVEAMDLGPHTIPPGTTVFICIQGVHHDPEIWKNPKVFDPVSRFVDPVPIPAPYTFLPFLEGPRNCLGQYLALLESKIVLSLLMLRYNFDFVGCWDGIDPKHRYIVPVIPKNGCNVRVSRL